VSTTSISLDDLRSKIIALPQEPFFLHNSSVRRNMRPWRESTSRPLVTDEQIVASLEEVGLWHKFLEVSGEHEAILDTPMTVIEGSLSQGEKQLFCLARALLTEGKIVVLDEATSK
jgi:ATP-binding cassette subfamily C (CFTR/MRP) protein 1